MKKLRDTNTNLKNLKVIFKDTNNASVLLEMSDIISNTTDSRAFIYVLDRFETEKALTREVIEDIIDYSYDFNVEVIEKLDSQFSFKHFGKWFTIKKTFLLALFLGTIIGIVQSEKLLTLIVQKILGL